MPQKEVSLVQILSHCLYIVLLLASVFQTGISSVKADVRCYCNLPACVSSGYMCKSARGVCVSDHFGFVSDRGDVWRSRHSCLELLDKSREEGGDCFKDEGGPPLGRHPIRICCKEDMCNYAKSEAMPQSAIHKLNHSYMTGYLSKDEYFFGNGGAGNLSPRQHLWFRAAVIAVPITGGCILIILIVVAAKILREDNKRQQPTPAEGKPPHSHTFDTCVLYDESSSKQQKPLFLPKSISSAIVNLHHSQDICNGYASSSSIGHPNELYRNASIATSSDTACTDTSRDKYFVFDV